MIKILIFLLLTTNAFAQNVTRVTSQSQHPYRHKATDLQSTALPSDGQCASYDSASGGIEWTTCGTGGGGGGTLTAKEAGSTIATFDTLDFRAGFDLTGTYPEIDVNLDLSEKVGVTDDTVWTNDGTQPIARALSDCDDSAGNHLNYDTSTNTWSCGTTNSAGWTDDGSIVRLTTSSDTVGIGTNNPIAKFEVVGNMSVGINDTGGTKDLSAKNAINFGNVTGSGSYLINNGDSSLVGGYIGAGTDVSNNGRADITSVYATTGSNQVMSLSNGNFAVTSDTTSSGVTYGFDVVSDMLNNGNNFLVSSNQNDAVQYFSSSNGDLSVDAVSSDTIGAIDFSSSISGKGNISAITNSHDKTNMFAIGRDISSVSRSFSGASGAVTSELAVNSNINNNSTNLFSFSSQGKDSQLFGTLNDSFSVSQADDLGAPAREIALSFTGKSNFIDMMSENHTFDMFGDISGTISYSHLYNDGVNSSDAALSSDGNNFFDVLYNATDFGLLGYFNNTFSASSSYGAIDNVLSNSGEGNLISQYVSGSIFAMTGNGNFALGSAINNKESKVNGNYSGILGQGLTVTGDSVFALGKNVSLTQSNAFVVGFNSSPSTTASLYVDSTNVGIGTTTPVAKLQVNGNIATNANTDDSVMVANGNFFLTTPLPSGGTNGCSGSSDKMLYNSSTNSFSCGVDLNTGGGGGGSTIVTAKENNSTVATFDTVDFGAGFDVSGSYPEVEVSLDLSETSIPYDRITSPSTSHGIAFSSFTNTWTSSVGNATFFTIDGSGTDFVVQGDGDTTVADLTIGGDDLFMATNTSGAVLVADGTNFNPVVMSGDAVINSAGSVTIQANSVALGTDTTGNYALGDGEAGNALGMEFQYLKTPTTNSGINFGAFTSTWTSSTGNHTWTSTMNGGDLFNIVNTTSDLTSDTALLNLKFVDNGDANGIFLKMTDNGSAEEKLKVYANGDVQTWNISSFTHLWTGTQSSGDVFSIGTSSNPILRASADASVTIGDAAEASYVSHLRGYTSDPCGTIPARSHFWNDTADEPCVCTKAGVDLRTKDLSTACF